MLRKPRKRRVPALKFTKVRGISWHVCFRDAETGMPRKHRFGMLNRDAAEQAYHDWVSAHLRGQTPGLKPKRRKKLDLNAVDAKPRENGIPAEILPGSLLHITSGLLRYEESRIRAGGEARRAGSITREVYEQRKAYAQEILQFINTRHGQGAVGRTLLSDLSMADVEAYNKAIVDAEYSSSQVTKRLQFVKAIIDRAGRPEHNGQVLSWNWASRDVIHGKPAKKRQLPTLSQLKAVLRECGPRETAMVWMAIGCGFGQRDLAALRVGQVDKQSYDLRRGKTGIERYGETPPMVWKVIQTYLKQTNRSEGELMFITAKGMPVVHEHADSVHLWWSKLQKRIGEECQSMGGFYTLRHLGATEFGSRVGCSIGAMKRWLGHSASSDMADVYMKPVTPENRAVVEWVRGSLHTGKADLRIKKKPR
ncbi:MAG: site-specific integrase [Planctomycetes bacterium]|nr:site-specific integrase [Planctomycetota bacterium]